MKVMSIALLLILPIYAARADSFCRGTEFVPFDQLVEKKAEYLNIRVRTRGIFRTNGKDLAVVTQDELSKAGLRLERDEIAQQYLKDHHLPETDSFDLIADFYERLRESEGTKTPLDTTQLARYRQERELCGRVIKSGKGFAFVADDIIRGRSYLVKDR